MSLDSTYVRGATGRPVGGRRIAWFTLAACAATFAAVGIALAVGAAGYNTDLDTLKRHGVQVQVTVTGCVGKLTGTGITATGYTCRGHYVLGTTSREAVIHGTEKLLPQGATISGVTLTERPATLYTAASVARSKPSWRRFITAGAVLLSAVVVAAAGAIFLSRSHRHTTAD